MPKSTVTTRRIGTSTESMARAWRSKPRWVSEAINFAVVLVLLAAAFVLLLWLVPGVVRDVVFHDPNGDVLLAMLLGVLFVAVIVYALVARAVKWCGARWATRRGATRPD